MKPNPLAETNPVVRMAEGYREIEEKVQAKKPKDHEEADRIRHEVQEEEKSDAS